jgi:hypothetical protein
MSTRIETAKKFIDCFRTLDGNEFARLKTLDCLHYFAPASLGMPEFKSSEDFSAHIDTLRNILKAFPVFVNELWDGGSQITIWATSETQFHEQAMDDGLSRHVWSYRGEYVFILEFNDTGGKISRIVEFLDSKATEDLRTLMKRARRNVGLEEKQV